MVAEQISLPALHTHFLALLPRIELHGRIFFRYLKCAHQRAEAIQEMRALAWKWFVRLAHRGKDAGEFIATFAHRLACAVHNGRRVSGTEKAKDVTCPRTQRRHGFRIESLPISNRTSHDNLYATVHGQRLQDAMEERLRDNTQTPVPDQAAFRTDWPAWMVTRTRRDRRIIGDLMAGERTLDVSKKFGLSPGRVSQLRREFQEDWERFTADPSDAQVPCAA